MNKMMQTVLKVLLPVLILTFTLPALNISAAAVPVFKDLRGVWVATVVNIDYPSKPTADPEILKSEAIKILDNARATGLNAVFLQVRPTADALYPSSLFPWSKYLTGTQGLAPGGNFDPLAFWITEAHNRGMELHAWINPYRVTKKASGEPSHDFASLAPSNPAVLHPEWVVKHPDGNLYFNPGIPEVRKLVTDGVLELVQNYPIDGIHFDDYFYPGSKFADQATYDQYVAASIQTGTAILNLDDWRRENVNTLIREVSQAIKSTGKNVRFGISPFGIWANKSKNSLGSDTNGAQSYTDHYADTRKWVKEHTIDYIAPQLYWHIGYSIADYSKLVSWWKNTVEGTGVDLYIGQAAYRTGNTSTTSAWYGISEIEKQLKYNAAVPEIKGSIFFSYKSLADSPALAAMIRTVYEQRDGITASVPVTASWPSGNIRTSVSKYYLNGSSDPAKPLYINGQLVENRSSRGFFGMLVPLAEGPNVFTFSQEGSYVTRVIYRAVSSTSSPAKMKSADIPAGSVYPQTQQYRTPGEKITLTCQAPIGSKVTVRLGGKTYTMKPSATKSLGSGLYPTTYTYVYTIPTYTGTPRVIDLGAPTYTMKYKGKVKTRKAPSKIGVIMKNAPFYAEVTREVIDTYNSSSSGDGAAFELYQGMVDAVTGMTGSYARLSSGQWVRKTNVRIYTAKKRLQPVIRSAAYTVGDKWDVLSLKLSSPVAATASFDGTAVKMSLPLAASAPIPILPDHSLFSSVSVSKDSQKVQYTLKLKENARLEGYCIEKTSTGLTLNIKRHPSAQSGGLPLTGITIMLDAGHGGSEPGAIGPMGLQYAEKDINLKTALKLQAELETMGAKVLMTRTANTTLSLIERLAASRKAKPDMFLSIHANSMPDGVDISKIQGFSVYYREWFSRTLSSEILNNTLGTLGRNDHGMHKKNFYVMRGTWTPSILIESGFVPNPAEFEWLIDENEQSKLVKTLADSIARYFAQ